MFFYKEKNTYNISLNIKSINNNYSQFNNKLNNTDKCNISKYSQEYEKENDISNILLSSKCNNNLIS